MAYPTVSAPYGLRPVNIVGGQPYAGSTRMYPVATDEGTAIYYGDVVKLNAAGGVTKDEGTTAATPVGVFMGCTYTDPNSSQKVFKQYCPATPVASDVKAYIADDPNLVFKVAVVSGTTVMSGLTQASVNANAPLVQNAGSTITGNSKVALLSSSPATTNTLPVRIVGGVEETKNSSGSYTEVLVIWNASMHRYNNTLGT